MDTYRFWFVDTEEAGTMHLLPEGTIFDYTPIENGEGGEVQTEYPARVERWLNSDPTIERWEKVT